MLKNISEEYMREKLIEYYKEKGLLIVGLNDSQGINVNTTFFKKGMLECLAETLSSEDLTPEVINAFSLLMNKTEHIDYFLKSNLSLEEIKWSQIYSAVGALEKVMVDLKLPKFISGVGNVYRKIYAPSPEDNNIHITTALKEAFEPTVIYSSGVNNLMREIGNNPFAIKRDYKQRNVKPNYNYTLIKTKKAQTLNNVIDSISMNLENILKINGNADVYMLGAYIPASLREAEMDIFIDLIIRYNCRLEKLCEDYHITFIKTHAIGSKFNHNKGNFHISKHGHDMLAISILKHMYEKKILLPKDLSINLGNDFEVSGNGSRDLIDFVSMDYTQKLEEASKLFGYDKERALMICEEHIHEKEVFEKVLRKTKTRVTNI